MLCIVSLGSNKRQRLYDTVSSHLFQNHLRNKQEIFTCSLGLKFFIWNFSYKLNLILNIVNAVGYPVETALYKSSLLLLLLLLLLSLKLSDYEHSDKERKTSFLYCDRKH